jgi:hypothetical protein
MPEAGFVWNWYRGTIFDVCFQACPRRKLSVAVYILLSPALAVVLAIERFLYLAHFFYSKLYSEYFPPQGEKRPLFTHVSQRAANEPPLGKLCGILSVVLA